MIRTGTQAAAAISDAGVNIAAATCTGPGERAELHILVPRAEAAKHSLFGGLIASGWHTAAMTMRLMLDGEFKPAGGILGVGFDGLSWPRPVRPGDELHAKSEVLEVRPSKSRPDRGTIKVRTTTFNQNDEPVMIFTGNLLVPRRPVST